MTIILPLKRLKIREFVATSPCDGPVVIYFPAAWRTRVSVLVAVHKCTASVPSGLVRVGVSNRCTLPPDCFNDCWRKAVVMSGGVWLSERCKVSLPRGDYCVRGNLGFALVRCDRAVGRSQLPPRARRLQFDVPQSVQSEWRSVRALLSSLCSRGQYRR